MKGLTFMHKYLLIENYLKELIEKKIIRQGDKIETEEELALRFNVSRPTVRQAINRLVQNGYLTRIKGSGTFVTEPKLLHISTSFISSYRREAAEQGYEIGTEVLELSAVKADEKVCEKLGIKEQSSVIKLTRLRRIKERKEAKPAVYTTVYVPFKMFPEMEKIDFTDTSLYDTLEEHGFKISRVNRELEVVQPPREVREALRLDAWEPAVFISSKGFLENGSAMEYAESWYPASTSKFLIELER